MTKDESFAVHGGLGRSHGRALKSIGERAAVAEVLNRLATRAESDWAPVIVGPGDDAAAFSPPPGEALIVTTDSLVESVHFERAWTTPADLGFKLMQAAASDVGAMGGRPLGAVVAVSAPPELLESELLAMTGGMLESAERHRYLVLGGDTTSSPHLVLTATVLGAAAPTALRRRSGAHPGDRILVTGELGDAVAGLHVLRALSALEVPPGHPSHTWLRTASPLADLERRLAARHLAPRADSAEALAYAAAVRRFLRPAPPIEAGPIAATAGASAIIDISDGLASELALIAEASAVGLVLEESAVPIGAGARRLALERGEDPLAFALSGGEDYELLMTAPADRVHDLTAALAEIGVRLTMIGEIVRHEFGRHVHAPGRPPQPLTAGGFEHFRRE
jgi:thiamine-monophosphate kinase